MIVTVLIMAKAPVPGLVKTRLGPPLTHHEAAAVAAAALTDTLTAVGATSGVRRVLALGGELDQALGASMISGALAGFTVIRQRGVGLAERIVNAHLDSGPGPVFQVGMDTPQLTPELIKLAVRDLVGPDGPDAVLGPAVDGGWWGLGLRRSEQVAPVGRVRMSTPDTGSDTLAALRSGGLRVGLLPALRDVDTIDDAVAVAATAPGTRFAELVGTLTGPAVR
ncbi:TIGR04282 family arsenosugar biosynthesis glycosyltransferase [Microlunatus parietis]|uniref:Glycosyltransferase involved in cell wall biogenesis n=1 Tax=Microlunatus parietis TaxID=682979 RepID=A0A7Y9IBZ0_9ACTN|nr:DUF2064 domain-containing protein [Microlunatus parietis]NYE73985.1 hypothetical protein [Microlunatus parietis]